jgi:DNA mismatch repair protein MSH4
VKANCNKLLDVARETYKENLGDIYQLNRTLSEEHGLPFTLIRQNTGFVFGLKKNELDGELPKGFVNVKLQKGRWIFSCMDLVCFFRLRVNLQKALRGSPEKDECTNARRTQ